MLLVYSPDKRHYAYDGPKISCTETYARAIASTIIACRNLGATKRELLSYATSGDVSGNAESVVGYGAIKFV